MLQQLVPQAIGVGHRLAGFARFDDFDVDAGSQRDQAVGDASRMRLDHVRVGDDNRVGQFAALVGESSRLGQIAGANRDVVAAIAQLDVDGQQIVQSSHLRCETS